MRKNRCFSNSSSAEYCLTFKTGTLYDTFPPGVKILTFNVIPLCTFYIACVVTHDFKAGISDSLLLTAVGHLYKMLVLEQTYFFISGIIGMKNFIDNRNHKFRTISKKCTEYIIVWCTGHSVFPFFNYT